MEQEPLIHRERLEGMQHMARSMAHDLNNAIAPIVGYAELLLVNPQTVHDPDKVRFYAQLIKGGADSVNEIMGRLRWFCSPPPKGGELSSVDLEQVAKDCAAGTYVHTRTASEQDVAETRPIEVELDTRCVPPITAQAEALREAVKGLLANAADAMPQGGTAYLRTRYDQARDEVILEVEDSGAGMADDVRRRCIEPYFTTKEKPRHQGLGLAVAYATADRHGGSLEIDSTPGAGTTVRLRLPRSAPRTAEPN